MNKIDALKKISVITPVLNGERFLRQTIKSVLSQTGDFELEYIIKDGRSTDKTLAIANEFSNHPSVKIVSKADSSLYDAINQGFEYASGDYGCWINADDCYEPGALQKVCTAFQKNVGRKWLYGQCDIIDDKECEIRKPITLYKKITGWHYSKNMLLCENYINQPATFWEIDLWKTVGGLSTDYKIAEDYHLWLKFAQESKAIALHQKLAHFRRCGESISDNQFELQFQEELLASRAFAGKMAQTMHRFNCWKIISIYKLLSK